MSDSNHSQNQREESGFNRRQMLQRLSAAGGATAYGLAGIGNAAAAPGRGQNVSEQTDDPNQLGDFEDGVDGWRTNGGNELTIVSRDELATVVKTGQQALLVETDGDMYPMIENSQQVSNADFVNNPYLAVHVVGLAEGTDSDLAFKFRLHHSASNGNNGGGPPNGNNGGGSAGRRGVTVEESDIYEVPQLTTREIQWDMTDISDEVLESANRLEIVWYLVDHEPDGGPRGRTNGSFDYRGVTAFDDIRLAESEPINDEQRLNDLRLELHREHGNIVDRNVEDRQENFERGTLVYVDETEVAYEFEIIDAETARYTFNGETFELEGS